MMFLLYTYIVDGGWSNWSVGNCSKLCDGGVKMKTRSCSSPTPSCGGNSCTGKTIEAVDCNTMPCIGLHMHTCVHVYTPRHALTDSYSSLDMYSFGASARIDEAGTVGHLLHQWLKLKHKRVTEDTTIAYDMNKCIMA